MVRSKIFEKLGIILSFVALFILYTYKLESVPVHLNQDELAFSLNAYSVAHTLRDTSGRFLPFYFWHLGSFWATPIIVYLNSILLLFLPLTESSVRLTGVLVTFFSSIFFFFLTNNIFQDKKVAILSTVLFLTTPVLFINSRVLLDNIFPIPFVILWLYFLEKENYFWAGLALGIGLHSYHAAKITMPVYFLSTTIYFFVSEKNNLTKTFRKAYPAFLGFLIPIILFIPWLIKYPDTLLNQVSYIGGLDNSVKVSSGIFGVFNPQRMGLIAKNYFTYFSPKILLLEGDRSLIHSTAKVGAFLLPTTIFLLVGILNIIKTKNKLGLLALLGFLTYPLAPAIVNDPQRISRGLIVVPLAILVAGYGVNYLLTSKKIAFRVVLAVTFLLLFLQFSSFIKDYFGDYRARSHAWFNNDIPQAFEYALRSGQKTIYVDKNIRFGLIYMDFYQKKTGITSKRIQIFDPTKALASGLIVSITKINGNYNLEKTIQEPDGQTSFYIYSVN